MSALRLGEVVQEVFHLRLFNSGWPGPSPKAKLFRGAQFLRHVWHGQAASALKRLRPDDKFLLR